MKKLLAILTTLVLILGCSSAMAADASGALPDLGGGLPSLQGSLPSVLAPIPDPAESLGSTGAAYQTGYSYNGKTYDLYLYSKPDTADAFIEAYTKAATEAGYKVTKGAEAGNDALYITEGDTKAILLYDYQGYMMLMVPKGADFTLRESVKPTPVPALGKNYMVMEYNGVEIASKESEKDAKFMTFGDAHYGWASFYFSNPSPISHIYLGFPTPARKGDVFTVTKADGDGGNRTDCFITLNIDDKDLISGGTFFIKYYSDCVDSDYFTIKITKFEKTGSRYLVEGTFEGTVVSNGKEKVEIKNGFFSTYVE